MGTSSTILPAWCLTLGLLGVLAACDTAESPVASPASHASPRWCDELPRPANAALERAAVATDWFHVYRVADGVFALAEPYQFQEVISYLILGTERALLLDTGIGLVPIRAVVEQLTKLPVEVINSHTHFDHVGGNAEFERILALDTPYTRANTAGFSHAELAGEVAPDALCRGAPAGADLQRFHTRPWKPSRFVADGETIDLGDRVIEVLHVPGHSPDALALLDRANGYLWTGDSYYEATIWLYVPETDLDRYEQSMARLVALAPALERLFPAHNTATADPGQLGKAADAMARIRAGAIPGTEESGKRMVFRFDRFNILVSKPSLEGKRGDQTRGGSGLTTWP